MRPIAGAVGAIDELVLGSSDVLSTWPVRQVPLDDEFLHNAGIEALLAEVMDTIEQYRRLLASSITRLAAASSHVYEALERQSQQQPRWRVLLPRLQLLDAAATFPVFIVEKLILIEEGAQMNEYNITQRGENLVAIVDSFKITNDTVASRFGQDAAYSLQRLVESVASADVAGDEKESLLEAIRQAAGNAADNGRLQGPSRYLWDGLRQALAAIPSAVAAWEALGKLWT